jgi:Uma2 family endonuclease
MINRVTTIHPISLAEQQHIVLDGVSWETYEQILRDLQNRRIRVTYDRGSLEMMAPLPYHERWTTRFGRLIEMMCLELDIEIDGLGSSTFRREDIEKGLEPDECYYIQHADAVRNKDEIDLSVDPPPDLVVEIDITRTSIPKQPIYAALGVPEIWRFDGTTLTVLRLRKGKYHPAKTSGAFPFLPMDRFRQFVLRLAAERQAKVLREFREWVKTL